MRPFALILVNCPLYDNLFRLWKLASFHVCADGGANYLYDSFNSKERSHLRDSYIPHAIIGDLDSAREDVLEVFLLISTSLFLFVCFEVIFFQSFAVSLFLTHRLSLFIQLPSEPTHIATHKFSSQSFSPVLCTEGGKGASLLRLGHYRLGKMCSLSLPTSGKLR